jgi:hypothetical protein
MQFIPTGEYVNRKILECGVVPLINFDGTKLLFFPRGRAPAHVVAYLRIHNDQNLKILTSYLINLGRGLHDSSAT